MRHEFRAPTLRNAVAKAVGRIKAPLQRKSRMTIDAGVRGTSERDEIRMSVVEGQVYEIYWEAADPAVDGAVYSIRISSHDGYGTYSETFTDYGSWSFEAEFTHDIQFSVEVSFSDGSLFFSYPVYISIY